MADSVAEIQKAKKLYFFIGMLLFFFTVVTVLVATVEALDFGDHGFDGVDATIGLIIAAFKASLVMIIFMHLNHEKKAVYWIFSSGLVFVIALFALFALAKFDPIFDNFFYNPTGTAVKPMAL